MACGRMVSVLPRKRTRGARKGIPINVIIRLIERPAKNAEEIEGIVRCLIDNAENSTDKMGQVTYNVNIQKAKLRESKNDFSQLYTEIKSVGEVAEEISNQTDVLEDLKGIVSKTVERLLSTVEESIAATQETNASMQVLTDSVNKCMKDTQNLHTLSQRQNEEAKKFKL